MWTWDQSKGTMTSEDGSRVFSGYSGADWGKNNPAAESVANVGPVPCGVWSIGPPIDSPNTGPYTLGLSPKPGTDTLGRSEFRIHGDSATHPGEASHGCIILQRSYREAIWNSNDHVLTVVA